MLQSNDSIPSWPCFYCGEAADTIDHVVPESMLKDLQVLGDAEVSAILIHRNRVMEVDCCRDCNNRLGNAYSQTLDARRELLKTKLRNRYQALLRAPDWTDAELGRMGPILREYILIRITMRDVLRRRLAYQGAATRYGMRVT